MSVLNGRGCSRAHFTLFGVYPQLLERGDTVVAAAREPSSSSGLMALQKQHPQTLSLITLDTADASAVEVCSLKNEQRVHAQIPGNMRICTKII